MLKEGEGLVIQLIQIVPSRVINTRLLDPSEDRLFLKKKPLRLSHFARLFGFILPVVYSDSIIKTAAMDNGHRENICARFCSYYKPGKSGESACLGFLVIQDLAGRGCRIEIPPSGTGQYDGAADCELGEYCGYRAADCDFAAGVRGAPPCGGLIVVRLLLGSGIITASEVWDSARRLHHSPQ